MKIILNLATFAKNIEYMNFFNLFPGDYVEDVFSVDYDRLMQSGVKALIFDIDNTLVPHGTDTTPQIDEFFRTLHAKGLKTLLLSNNSDERIRTFNRNIQTLYISNADKPNPKNFLKALELLDTKAHETVVIGDTIFTDIVGANRAGIPSVLVKYHGYYKKEKKGIRRRIESVILVLYSLTHKRLCMVRR